MTTKNLTGALLIFALVHHGLAADPVRAGKRELIKVIGNTNGKSWTTKWTISEATLKATSQWDTSAEPPLSVAQAVKAARLYLRAHGRSDQLPILHVHLQAPMRSNPGEQYYFYFVSFDDPAREEPSPEDVDVLILLNGSVVAPDSAST